MIKVPLDLIMAAFGKSEGKSQRLCLKGISYATFCLLAIQLREVYCKIIVKRRKHILSSHTLFDVPLMRFCMQQRQSNHELHMYIHGSTCQMTS